MRVRLVFLSCLAVFFVVIFCSDRFIYALPGESLSTVWIIDLFKNKEINLFNTYYSQTNFPWGFAILNHNYQPVYVLLLFFFSKLPLSSYGSYQLLIFLAFFGSFGSFYFVSKMFGLSSLVRFLPPLIVTSSNFLYWRASQHLEMALLFFIPFYLYFLFKAIEKPSFRRGAIAGFFLSLCLMTSFQHGFFLFLFTPFLLLLSISFPARKRLKGLLFMAGGLAFSSVIFSSLVLFNIYLNLKGNSAFFHEALNRNSLNDLIALGARPWDYFLPSSYHPFFGSFVKTVYRYFRDNFSYQFWSANITERSNFVPLTVLIPSLFIGLKLLKSSRRTSLGERGVVQKLAFFFLLAGLGFLLSLPAVVSFSGLKFYLPSFFIYQFVPVFRVYSRAGLFFLIALSFAFGIILDLALKEKGWRIGRFGFSRKFVVVVIAFMILFENLSYPPLLLLDRRKVPQAYLWLKDHNPERRAIIEYPKDNSYSDLGGGCPSWLDPKIVRSYNNSYSTFFQMIHRASVFGYESLTTKEKVEVADLTSEGSYNLLRRYEVSFVVLVLKDPLIGVRPWPFPQENPLDECWRRRVMLAPEKVFEKFRKVAEFEDSIVYKVD